LRKSLLDTAIGILLFIIFYADAVYLDLSLIGKGHMVDRN